MDHSRAEAVRRGAGCSVAARAWLLAAGLALGACGSGAQNSNGGTPGAETCANEKRADAWALGTVRTGTGGLLKAKLVAADPAPPIKGDNVWTLQILDASDQPLDGVALTVKPFMPDHGHGTPIAATVTEVGMGHQYRVTPVNLWMPGYWEIRLTLDAGGGKTDATAFKICIDG